MGAGGQRASHRGNQCGSAGDAGRPDVTVCSAQVHDASSAGGDPAASRGIAAEIRDATGATGQLYILVEQDVTRKISSAVVPHANSSRAAGVVVVDANVMKHLPRTGRPGIVQSEKRDVIRRQRATVAQLNRVGRGVETKAASIEPARIIGCAG